MNAIIFEHVSKIDPGAAVPAVDEVAPGGAAPLQLDSSMREALTKLLQAETDSLPVAGPQGRPVGQVTLAGLRRQLRGPALNSGERRNRGEA